ncbi:VWA domain-containing protein [Mesorhizobium sp. M7A.F.Ca.US.002.01.1.1]|uniref:phage tail protein n=1 Tax=Mesorhizobium sp. M7A.F.Ca.US.002.01.1.1 TaxID=2496700 RepID=UPI000FD51EA4|nr:phage tail protein [Mesorhizobium sp. M7A.F.Ca.US.002.01.1.1]RVA08572.1 VWA domain-containing protein [Mesorhizobium sp. M7A.F.Ca.US.002.01.1.1]
MFWNIIIAIASYALQLALTPKPQNAKPKSLEDFQAPTAEEGREIPVLFGTGDIADPNVTWYGDLKKSAIKGARRYGLFGPRQVLGYKYDLGMQMGLCHGVADALYGIRAGDKDAWKGIRRGGRITIHKANLFGGDQSEGGIEGDVDLCMGAPDQLQNDYLVAKLGPTISAFRGVFTVVLRQVYLGTSNYIKPWEFRVQRVFKRSDGSDQWYKQKAGIGEVKIENTAIYIALDVSSSMTGTRLAGMKTAVVGALQEIQNTGLSGVDIRMVAWAATVTTSIERRSISTAGYNDLIAWVNGLVTSGGTNFEAAVSQAAAFFAGSGSKRRLFIFVTDGEPFPLGSAAPAAATLGAIADVEAYGFNIDLSDTSYTGMLDNTPDDGVPVVAGGDPQALRDALTLAFSANIDMNPAHIIRECLTDRVWGMGYNDSDIDETSFVACADTFYAERFGLTLKWYREEEIEEFVSTTVLPHVDAVLYVSRSTGKFVLKAIRDDYDIDLIPVFTEDEALDWDISRRQPSEAINAVLVKYYNRQKRKDGAHLVTNTAQAMQSTNGVRSTTREYPGITNTALATRVATRDVISLGSGLVSGSVVLNRSAEALNPGDPFRVVSARNNLAGEVMRNMGMNLGDGRTNKITVKVFQDVFRLGASVLVDDSQSPWLPPSNEPLPVSPRLAWEMPYREARQMVGDADLATMLSTNPDAGLLQVAGSSPSPDAVNAEIQIDAGGGYAGSELVDFAPGAFLNGDVAIDATEITVTGGVDLGEAALGTLAAIVGATPGMTEIVRVDDVDGNALTIARGCLDTVPLEHATGAAIVLFDDINNSDFEVRSAGDSISVKLLTIAGLGTLEPDAAPTDVIVFDSRAIRPLRPANVKIEGEAYGPVTIFPMPTEFAVEWANRNRLTESVPLSWTDPGVAQETDQTTTITVMDADRTVLTVHDGLVGESFVLPATSFVGAIVTAIVRVTAKRDGYESMTGHEIVVTVSSTPDGALLLSGDAQSGTDALRLSGDAQSGTDRLQTSILLGA